MDELVDRVNENDEVIGKALKSACHTHQWWHRGSAILVFRDNSYIDILVQKRSLLKHQSLGMLCFPGGHLRAGDTYEEGAWRELQEELFFNQSIPQHLLLEPLFKLSKTAEGDHEYDMVFRTMYPGPFFPDPSEVESVFFEPVANLWRNPSRLASFTPTARVILEAYGQRYSLPQPPTPP